MFPSSELRWQLRRTTYHKHMKNDDDPASKTCFFFLMLIRVLAYADNRLRKKKMGKKACEVASLRMLRVWDVHGWWGPDEERATELRERDEQGLALIQLSQHGASNAVRVSRRVSQKQIDYTDRRPSVLS